MVLATVKTQLSPIACILLLAAIAVIISIIVLIKKLKYDFKQVLKSLSISFLISILVEIILLIIGLIFFFSPILCKPSGYCPSQIEMFLQSIPYTLPLIFLIVSLIYLTIKLIKKKK